MKHKAQPSMAAAGVLSEYVGGATLISDKNNIKIGLRIE
jgi:hypothetical protein